MNNRAESSWVPDKLPDFNQESIKFKIGSSDIWSGIKTIAKLHQVSEVLATPRLMVIGAYAIDATIILHNNKKQKEKTISIIDKDLGRPRSRSIVDWKKITVTLPRNQVDHLMEIANTHKITIEELIERMLRLGIKIVKAQDNPKINYILRMENKDINFKHLNPFE